MIKFLNFRLVFYFFVESNMLLDISLFVFLFFIEAFLYSTFIFYLIKKNKYHC